MMFDPFDDFETAGYLRNVFKLKDPAQIKKMEHLAFESSLEDAISLLSSCRHITYQTLLELHHLLFADFYPWLVRTAPSWHRACGIQGNG